MRRGGQLKMKDKMYDLSTSHPGQSTEMEILRGWNWVRVASIRCAVLLGGS